MLTLTSHFPFIVRREQTRSSVAIGWMALVVTIISGATFPVLGKELTLAFSPLALLFITESIALASLAFSFGIVPIVRKILRLRKKDIVPLVALGSISGFLAPLIWFFGMGQTTAVNSELFSRTQMIFMILLSAQFLGERITKKEAACLSIIALGTIVVALHGFREAFVLERGDALIIFSAILYALGAIISKKYLHNVPPELAVFSRSMSAILAFFLLSPFLHSTLAEEVEDLSQHMIVVLIAYGLIGKFISIYTFHQAMDRLTVATVSSVSTLSILGAIVLAALYLGERIESYHAVGGSLIIAGILLSKAQLRLRQHWEKHEEHQMRQHHRHHL